MRRIAILLIVAAAVAGLHACAADAPTNPGPGTGGGGTALQIQLNTSDSNPDAGTCTLIQATVLLNGNVVPDGTSVNFSTDFGSFSQNGQPLISIVTQNGVAVTALCGPGAGVAKVRATTNLSGNTGSANLTINFQPSSSTLPFVASCSPSFGPKEGGTELTLNGGRFFGTAATTRVQFTVNGVTKDGIVQSVSPNQIVVLTPGFTEFSAPQLPAQISLSLGTNQPVPVVLSLPSCFSYGAVASNQPILTSLLPSGGSNEGGTRVTIVGSGFSTTGGVQVLFGTVEATVISVSYNQVVVLSPPQFGTPTPVAVTVRNITSGLVSDPLTYNYGVPLAITSVANNIQELGGPYGPVTIFGRGFQAPVAVTLAGWAAVIQSVSATELVVVPSNPSGVGCADITGPIRVVNINSGESVIATQTFTYDATSPVIISVNPDRGLGNAGVTISGLHFPNTVLETEVKFGSVSVNITSISKGNGTTTPDTIQVSAPTSTQPSPTCTGTNLPNTPQTVETVSVTVTDRTTGCTVTAPAAFQEQLPCVLPPAP